MALLKTKPVFKASITNSAPQVVAAISLERTEDSFETKINREIVDSFGHSVLDVGGSDVPGCV
jgi:hypothetical protein